MGEVDRDGGWVTLDNMILRKWCYNIFTVCLTRIKFTNKNRIAFSFIVSLLDPIITLFVNSTVHTH
jgi:hypothetical protein